MPAPAQPGRRRSQPKGLPAKFVRRNQDDVQGRSIIAFPRRRKISVIIETRPWRERTARMPISTANSFGTRDNLNVGAQTFEIQRLEKLEKQGLGQFTGLPFS